jgi:hypothetical protein
MAVQRVAVVVFAEVEAVDASNAAFAVEMAVRQAMGAASVPGMARGYVQATLRHAVVPVRVAYVSELNAARNSMTVTPVSRVFEERNWL